MCVGDILRQRKRMSGSILLSPTTATHIPIRSSFCQWVDHQGSHATRTFPSCPAIAFSSPPFPQTGRENGIFRRFPPSQVDAWRINTLGAIRLNYADRIWECTKRRIYCRMECRRLWLWSCLSLSLHRSPQIYLIRAIEDPIRSSQLLYVRRAVFGCKSIDELDSLI